MKNKLLMQQNITFGAPGKITLRGGNDIDNLVNKILYWDSIVNINTDLVGTPANQDIETLKREGIFEDIKVDVIWKGEFSMMVAEATKSKILTLLDDKSVNYIPDNLSPRALVSDGVAHNTGGTLIHMVNTMPFIDVNTPLDKVLEFRHSRKEQLKNLTTTLNSMELRVSEAENQAMELKKVINEIDIACLEIHRLYSEKKFTLIPSDIKLNFNMKNILAIGASVYAGASCLLPQTGAALAGLVGGAVSVISWEGSVSIKEPHNTNPFSYTAEVRKQFK
ncbi:DUF6236 family protein [Klebsiella pneumoniae]|uniref:DUF6236 family protein n=1 Tax=Klebsiella pneumoniae TaxID=573 RepID=UPI000E2BDC23|nr:DUF6236 family protein [Klebsiella pneumoniae]SXL87835.1 Uncharacterised protein [Klebsiella pneumoniae]